MSPKQRLSSCFVVSFLIFLGCGSDDAIVEYKVKKSQLVWEENHLESNQTSTSTDASTAETHRMLAAIMPVGDQAWFFKLVDSLENVAKVADSFEKFIAGLSFKQADAGRLEPVWNLPEAWRAQRGNEMRFATIEVPVGNEKVEISVTSLGVSSENLEQYLLMNVNRWRGQLKLPPWSRQQLPGNSQEISLDGVTATYVDMTGQFDSGGMSRAPFAGGATPPRPSRTTASTANSPVRFVPPTEWSAGRQAAMRKASFEVVEGERKIDISIIDLQAGSGTLLANVNRWRGQVGLAAVTEADLEQVAASIDISGSPGHYVELVGESLTILGAIVEYGGKDWYVKLMGDTELAQREKDRFTAFLETIEFATN